jgi:hypothetical protein
MRDVLLSEPSFTVVEIIAGEQGPRGPAGPAGSGGGGGADLPDGTAKNQVLKWNGTEWVAAAVDQSFIFSIGSFSNTYFGTSQEIGTGVWKAAGALSFSAAYQNGPPDATPYISFSGWSSLFLTGSGLAGPTASSQAVNFPGSVGSLNFTLHANSGADVSSASASVGFYNRIYWGSLIKASSFLASDITGLSSNRISNSKNGAYLATASFGFYLLLAYPARLGTSTFTVNGFEGGFNSPETVSITNASGYTENYLVYRSTNPGLGSTTFIVS